MKTSEENVKLNHATVTKDSLNGDVDLVVLTPKSYDFAEAIEVVQIVQGKPFLLLFSMVLIIYTKWIVCLEKDA